MKKKRIVILSLIVMLIILLAIFIPKKVKTNFLSKISGEKVQATSNSSTVAYNQNDTVQRSKNEIKEKYDNTTTYDYGTSVYKQTPVDTAPYQAGSLQTQVINDTLNRINFYRWITGVEDVTLNSNKMERNQKGAVLLSKLGYITHSPTKPSDMDNDFFNDASLACTANRSCE